MLINPKINKWDIRFLQLADLVATWSKDPSTKVGAVLVRNKRIISTGFNGFSSGCDDSLELYINRKIKLSRIVHAETNAIVQCARFGASTLDCTIYTNFHPCSDCAKLIISAGINRVVTYKPNSDSKWCSSFESAQDLLTEAKVELTLYKN